MGNVLLGKRLRERRKALGIKQWELAQGICEPITISRIENGKQNVSLDLLSKILQRLKLPEEWVYFLTDESYVEQADLGKRIESWNVRFQRAGLEERPRIWQEAMAEIDALEQCVKADDTTARQEICRIRVLLGKREGPYSHQETVKQLMDAIHWTLPNFEITRIRDGLYTQTEIKIINQIAVSYIYTGEHTVAIHILQDLLSYVELGTQDWMIQWLHKSMIAYNYARELGVVGRYSEAVAVAQKYRAQCISSGQCFQLANLLAVLAECYYHMGEMEKSEFFYRQAFHAYIIMGDTKNAEHLQTEAEKYLGLALEG